MWNWIKELFFWFFNGDSVDNVGEIRDPVNQDLALEFDRNQNKDVSILTETCINHGQIHHVLKSGGSWKVKNTPKLFSKYLLQRQNMQNQKISELYTDDNKSKRFSNPKDILKSTKKIYKKTLHQGGNFQSSYYWTF